MGGPLSALLSELYLLDYEINKIHLLTNYMVTGRGTNRKAEITINCFITIKFSVILGRNIRLMSNKKDINIFPNHI